MKRTLQYIFDRYPSVKEKLDGGVNPSTNVEEVFYQMALFISDPEKYSFNINLLYKYLENEDLTFALQTIITFFQKDTYLIQNNQNLFINAEELKNTKLYNQTMFAKYLTNNGVNYSVNKFSTYYKRSIEGKNKKIPKPDLLINGTPYWYENTVQIFLENELQEKEE